MKPFITHCFHSLSAASLLCVHPLISLIGIFYSCCSATNEYKNIALALHKLSYASRDGASLRHLESFSLQLMMAKMHFTAKGVFEITNSTLRAVKVAKLAANCILWLHDFCFVDSVSTLNVLPDCDPVHAAMGHFRRGSCDER